MGPLGTVAVGPLNESTEPEPVEEDGARQVAALLYTSGTTGNPKGVMLTHRNILFNANISKMLRKPTPQDVIYGVLPMSHIVGFSIILAGTLMGGSAVHIVPKYDPAAFVKAVRDDGISLLFGVPTTYQRLLEYKATSGLNALPRGRLRGLYVAGAPLDPTLKATIEQEFGQPLLNGYGITECAPGISGVRSDAPRADCSVGTILPGIEVRLVGRDGVPVAERRGRRAACARPQRDARLLPRTGGDRRGDRPRRLVQHRRSRALRGRGAVHRRPHQGADHPVGLQRLSGRGRSRPERAPVGRPVGGRRPRRPANEEVVAYVQLLPGSATTIEELTAHAGRHLTAYKRPSEIVVLDALPASSTGKILKHRLAAAAAAARS